MTKPIFLSLTSVLPTPTKKGQNKIAKASQGGSLTDAEGRNAEWFETMNLPIPDELKDTNVQNGVVILEKDEIEFKFLECGVELSEISCYVDNEEMGCVIYCKDGSELWVDETADEIFWYIKYLTRGRWERFTDNVSHYRRNNFISLYFRRKKIKKQQENK